MFIRDACIGTKEMVITKVRGMVTSLGKRRGCDLTRMQEELLGCWHGVGSN